MEQEFRIMASWGPIFNLSTGQIVVDDQHFTLVPNKALTAMALSVGKGVYANHPYDIENIAGYENNFMAWMTILLRDGSKVKVKIEPGTQPGKTLRLRGKGLPQVPGYGSGQGDLVVNISVYVPKELSKEERKAIEELRDSENFKGDTTTKKSIFEKFKNYFS